MALALALPCWAALAAGNEGSSSADVNFDDPTSGRRPLMRYLPTAAGDPSLPDPTRASKNFEKTFRELSKGYRASPSDNKNKEKERKPLQIVLKATIVGGGKPGSALITFGKDQLRWLREGGETTVTFDNDVWTIKLEKLDEQGAHLLILPTNQTLILR